MRDEYPHIETLKTKHSNLDAQIEQLRKRPSVDPLELQHLQTRKLRVKDEVVAASSTMH
jgi:hypothetical protein